MPMSFPDMDSLKRRATARNFRQPHEGESEQDFRSSFSTFMRSVDMVESMEISAGSGWDKWSLPQSEKLMREANPEIGKVIDELRADLAPHKAAQEKAMIDKIEKASTDELVDMLGALLGGKPRPSDFR